MRYRVDLHGHLALCEANYRALERLVPRLAAGDRFALELPGGRFRLRVVERTPYTALVVIAAEASGWLAWPELAVRIYCDARLAEVVRFGRERRVAPRNPYPNRRMHQPDEKRQWNRFLGDFLAAALRHGQGVPAVCEV
ncbi:MAG: hypothetical protein KatS3mg124_2311 [Porticoccaceae bacterium]|nr:MAG: hypothetical protein KatS3mg124_2311 [Porticoccaceae bacterium]